MNYVRFLKHHAPLSELVDDIDQSTRNKSIKDENLSSKITMNKSNDNQIEHKIRRKVNIRILKLI